MKKITEVLSLKNIHFRKKMLIIYIICVIIPLIVLSIFYYRITVNKIEKQNINDLKFSLTRAGASVQNVIDNTVMMSDMIYCDNSIYNMLTKGENDALFVTAQDIDAKINAFMINGIIENIEIYTYNDELYRSGAVKRIEELKSKNPDWLKKFSENENSLAAVSHYNAERRCYTISIIRSMKVNIKTGKKDILKMDISQSAINEALNLSSAMYSVVLLNDENCVINMQNTENSNAEKYNMGDVINPAEKNLYFTDLTFPRGYKIAGKYSYNAAVNMLTHETLIFLLLICLIFSLSTAMILIITNAVVRTLNNLTDCTRKMECGRFEAPDMSEIGEDEIGVLTLGMNNAIVKINELINDVYKEKLKRAEIEKEKGVAEFNALQSQINPHFMFNLFEVVRMKALKKDDRETAAIMKNISVMFRSLIKWGNDLITVEKELIFINAFLDAQKYNLNNKVDICLDIDEKAQKCIIPKMTVQVFVENAFVHGLDSIYENRRFSLSARVCGDELVIKVSDNGEGMPAEVVNALNRGDRKNINEATHGIGIKNVLARLSLYFDSKFEISVSSIPFEKTEITLKLPVKMN